MATGRPLDAEILIARLQIRALFEYLNRPDRPSTEDSNTLRLIFRGCDKVAKLMLARKKLPEQRREQSGAEPVGQAVSLSIHQLVPV